MAQPINPSQLRPQRRWYAVAAAIGVASVVVSIVALTLLSFLPDTADPDFDNILFGDGQQLDVPLAANRDYGIYVVEGTSTRCSFGPGVTATPPSAAFTFLHDDESWRNAYLVSVTADGLYQVSCDAESFAVGEPPPDASWAEESASGMLVSLVGLPCVGIPAAIAGAIVVAALRSSDRRRLLRR